MRAPSVVILGGGLSGLASAYTLASAGWGNITIIERAPTPGGLAGSFERAGRFYPLGYHHISYRDHTLHFFLHAIHALQSVRWRKIRMLFSMNGRLENLGTPLGFLRFPMGPADKLRFIRMMLKTFYKSQWSDWEDRSAGDLIDSWGGPGVRRSLFEDLTRVKFELPCEEVSAAWLGARLYSREGSSPLGYIPGANWTKVLCDGVTRLVTDLGVNIRTRATITKLHTNGRLIREAELTNGELIGGDFFVSTLPTEVYCSLLPWDETPYLASIRYTALISVVCATRQAIEPDFYWMVLSSLDATASGIFRLNSLNPTIGGSGESALNFMTHMQSRERPLFRISDEELMSRYFKDFREVFGVELEPFWTNITRVPMYSPIFHRNYRNPPLRSTTCENVYFAGNYRTYPSNASTGTALRSGLEAGQAILQSYNQDTDLPTMARNFRVKSMPKG